MDIIFVACDGTQFDNKEECLNYESKLNLDNGKDFCFFDENGEIINFPPRYDIIDKLEESYFFICRTKECANALESFIEDQCGRSFFPIDIEPNVFYGYGIDGDEEWKNVSEVLRNYEARMNKLVNLNEKMTSRLS